jgi:DNA-binding NarL/FixJ family response regulator
MKVFLVGTPGERVRLRARLPPSVEVADEFATLGEARAAADSADGVVMLPAGPRALAGEEPADVEPLTARERAVLELLAEGLPNKAIAMRLGISDQTVKFHVAAIAGKLGAANRTEAVRLAVRRGLITL